MNGPEARPLTAIQIVSNLDVGGGQEVVRTLARYLPEVGCDPIVIALRDGPMRVEIERLGVRVELVPGRRWSILALPFALAELLRIRRDLQRIIRSQPEVVIQTHLLRSLDFLVLTLRRERSVMGMYWTVHNARLDLRPDQLPGHRWLLGPKRSLYRLLYRVGARIVDGLVAVSEDVGASVREQLRPPADKLVVIPNGVDVHRFQSHGDRRTTRESLNLPDAARVLIVLAKLHAQKGHRHLLDSLDSLLPRVPDLHVLIVGDGPDRRALEERVATMGATSRIHLLGSRSDVPQLLAASDIFVLPSLWEGLPMALLEAMATGLAVVATDVSGSREVVIDGESGLLVPPGDARALEAAILRLLGDRTMAKGMGEAARERVTKSFSGRTLAERHVAMYRSYSRGLTA